MAKWTLEQQLSALVMRGWYHQRQLDYAEFFAGHAELSRAALEGGLNGLTLDKLRGHDVLTGEGLRLWLATLTMVKQGGLAWFAPPCNSWVILCRAQSSRTYENEFLGDDHRYFVEEGNILGDITAMMCLLAFLLSIDFVIEQPSSSVLFQSACMKGMLEVTGAGATQTFHLDARVLC